jgi:hypothetical protein
MIIVVKTGAESNDFVQSVPRLESIPKPNILLKNLLIYNILIIYLFNLNLMCLIEERSGNEPV